MPEDYIYGTEPRLAEEVRIKGVRAHWNGEKGGSTRVIKVPYLSVLKTHWPVIILLESTCTMVFL